MPAPTWIPALPLADLPVGEARVVRHGGDRIAVFRPAEDELFACDDRCPHEGYPLARGSVRACVVTCPWHNYKFDLRDGRALIGDEQVRIFPIRLRGGTVEVDVAPPDPTELRARHLASLAAGVADNTIGQIARELVRLLALGVTPLELTLEAARLDARHAEYGTGHATATAIDALHLARRFTGPGRALPLIQGLSVAAESNQRLPAREVAAAIDPGDDIAGAGARLRAAVEEERLADAEAILRGALARGWAPATIEGWILELCADHILGFGHPLIYAVKIFELLGRAGWEGAADALLPALLARIVNSTREELVPEEAWFRGVIAAAEPELAAWYAACARPEAPALDHEALAAAILDGPRDAWVEAVRAALAGGARLESVADALVLAASERLLRFDPAIDGDPSVQEGWLDVTHRLTFASAIRGALARWRDPGALRLLFQAAHFIRAAAPLDLPAGARIPRVAELVGGDGDLEGACAAIVAAIDRHDGPAAVAAAARLLARDGGEHGPAFAALEALLERLALDDRAIRPIFAAHWIKVCVAAAAEARALPPGPARSLPLLACVRFFAGPIQERSLRATVHDAIRFVVEGKVPKTLT